VTAVVIAEGDDWEGLYIGGSLMIEGHHLDMVETIKTVLNVMPPVIANDVSRKWVDFDWIEEQGNLPSNIADVKWENEV
jgi:hypothetical protein